MMNRPLVSVFIRVRDEAKALEDVLRHLRAQVVDGPVEIVVLDNDSVDGSERVALAAGARVFTLPREHFGYGRALNIGVQMCQGTFFVPLSAHSIPQSPTWLADLIEPLRADEQVGAAFCHQVPLGAVSSLEMRRFACFPDQDTTLSSQQFVELCERGVDPYEVAVFSNSACAIRRDVALNHPFRDLLYAEDRAFVVDYLMSGGTVAYRRSACVSYERNMTWRSAFSVAYRAQVSKRLIRELAATYVGTRFKSGPETLNRLVRAGLVIPGAVIRMLMSLSEPRDLWRRSAVFAFRSTGATLGLAKGSLRWREHTETLACDSERFRLALTNCVLVDAPYPAVENQR